MEREQFKGSCVYKITNTVTGDFYVGSAVHYINRMNNHVSDLRLNDHHSPILQNSYNKHGEDNFKMSVLEVVGDKNLLIPTEQYYLDTLNPRYNIAKIAGSNLGIKRSSKTREKIRRANLGKKHSDKTKEKMREAAKSRPPISEETRARILTANKNKGFREIEQLTKDGEHVGFWRGAISAQRALGIPQGNIGKCCLGGRKSAGGFKWRFTNG